MPYKVVQTIEQGKVSLAAVPYGWEKNGILWWPPKSQVGSVVDENSIPIHDKWEMFSCSVKRQYKTYKEASEEAEKMEAETDTKQEQITNQKNNMEFGDFNSIILQQDAPSAVLQKKSPQIGENITLNNCNLENTFLLRNNEYSDLVQNQKTIIALLEKQAENTTRILTQLAKHDVCLGELYDNMALISNMDSNSDKNSNNILIEQYPPVKTLDELINLEDKLKDANFQSKYIRSMSTLCSQGTNMKGLTLCYRLIDCFITRDLLLECSWTGNTRSHDENEKTAFKFFERIRQSFFLTIHNADLSFSKIECDQFFKRILKNSKQRLFSTRKPRSTSTPINKAKTSPLPAMLSNNTIKEESGNPAPEELVNLSPEDEIPT